jgi:hypothetical protein
LDKIALNNPKKLAMKDNNNSPLGQFDNSVRGDDLPPFLKTWKNVYILVAGTLLLLIVLFYAFTLLFA